MAARGDQMRAGDSDRLRVVDALRVALDEGRLSLAEYDERVAQAYKSLTYADLSTLLEDLPSAQQGVLAIPMPPPTPPVVPPRPKPKKRRIPLALMILWTIWLAGVGVNMAVWMLVSVMAGHLLYFWPVWVAGPAGATLLAVTLGVDWIRHSSTDDGQAV